MSREELIVLAKQIATGKQLDPALVCAIIEVESNWEPFAIRHEPAFQLKYVMPLHLLDTETIARSISWGCMQLMGESARELGYKGPLAELCDPSTGIEYGCIHFRNKYNLAAKTQVETEDIVHKALLLWNGGADQLYPLRVMNRISKYR